MHRKISILSILFVVTCVGHGMAIIAPDPISGNYYEFVSDPATWDEARVDAKNRSFGGVSGHLATISNANENQLVHHLGGSVNKWIGLTDSTAMSLIDGFDLGTLGTSEAGDTSDLPLPDPGSVPTIGQRGAGFRWVTGEPFTFNSAWRTGAPSDFLGQTDGVHTFTGATWQDNAAGVSLGQPGIGGPALRASAYEFEIDLDERERFAIVERYAAPTFRSGTGNIVTLEDADLILGLPVDHPDVLREARGRAFVISFHDPDLGGGLTAYPRHPFLGEEPGVNDEGFVQQATAQVMIPSAGDWTFAFMTSERVRLRIGENEFEAAGVQPQGPARLSQSTSGALTAIPGGSGDTFYFPTAGVYDLELTAIGGDFFGFAQLFGAPGNLTSFDASVFRLVGDKLNGGIQIMVDPAADFDSDGDYDCADVDGLVVEIAAGTNDLDFDLTGDGLVDLDDLTQWRVTAGFANLPSGQPYPNGDANLDGVVDASDFNVWNSNKFTDTAAWCRGDWNADGFVDASDFNIWNANKFTSADHSTVAIPEPPLHWSSWLFLAVLLRCRSVSRRR